MFRSIAILTGLIFIMVGVAGFVPELTSKGVLFGAFPNDAAHYFGHIAIGIIALLCGLIGARSSQIFFRVAGLLFALLAIFGFFYGEQPIFGILANNMADTWLHAALGFGALLLGFGMR